MDETLKQTIKELYLVFDSYEINNFKQTSCFDYGPNEEELAGISKPLRDIPDNVLARMEFFAYGWDSWGSKNEIGYFLPRLMEHLANDISRLYSPGLFGLFKYKLRDLFSETNKDWTKKEKNSLLKFFTALLRAHLSKDVEVNMLIECALALNLAPKITLSYWDVDKQTKIKQLKAVFKHFKYAKANPKGLYFDDSERTKTFLDLLFEQLPPEEAATIY